MLQVYLPGKPVTTNRLMDSDSLLEKAEARWEALGRQHQELTPAIALQRRLLRRGLELAAVIERDSPLRITIDPADMVARLRMKRPAFSGEPIEVDASHLHTFVLAFCDDLAQGGAGGPAERLRKTLERREIDTGSLLSASLMRQLRAVRTTANHVGVAPDLLWLVAELGAAPLAHQLLHDHLLDVATTHDELGASLAAWQEGYCPGCGSWPALAEQLDDTRQLRCSFCGSAWRPAVSRCIYCSGSDDSFLTATSDGEPAARSLEMCRSCSGYLKRLRVSATIPFELLAVEDLASSDLDVSAAERGYSRPSMREIEAV